MAISPPWPKPSRWPIQPWTVDPGQRWVWHTRPRFILPLWEHASAGAAQCDEPGERLLSVWAILVHIGPGLLEVLDHALGELLTRGIRRTLLQDPAQQTTAAADREANRKTS